MPYVVKNYKDKIEKGPLVSKIFFYINDETLFKKKIKEKPKKKPKIKKKTTGFEKCNFSKMLAEFFVVA